jgi:type III secretion protein R
MKTAILLALVAPASALARGAQTVDLGGGTKPVPMMVLLAAMTIVPFAILMLTSFSKIAVVLSLARSAMGTQQAPPSMVLTGLAAVLTAHIMAPVAEAMYFAGRDGQTSIETGAQIIGTAERVGAPLRAFLVKHASAEERARFADLARELRPPEQADAVTDLDLAVVVPAFVITELKEAFQIGFLIFLPFLVVDMLVANVLLALGMQSLSPSQVSLPFKILLFVAVDGWALLSRGLVLGYR